MKYTKKIDMGNVRITVVAAFICSSLTLLIVVAARVHNFKNPVSIQTIAHEHNT